MELSAGSGDIEAFLKLWSGTAYLPSRTLLNLEEDEI
jgi:hypothetical protein